MKSRKEVERSDAKEFLVDFNSGFAEKLREHTENTDRRHPTPEQLLIRQAVKYLTPKQKIIWGYYNYDRLTQDEIAEKLNIARQVVGRHIRACETRITKWCKSNMGAYRLLKDELGQ